MRLLLIEDEASLRESLAARLAKEGFAVDAAADGAEGHFLGLENPIDLAIVDLGLPKLDGIEVIKRWRAAGRRFPVLILTARSRWEMKSTKARALAETLWPGGSSAATSRSASRTSASTLTRRPSARSSCTRKRGTRAMPWPASASARSVQAELARRRPVAATVCVRPPPLRNGHALDSA